MKKSNHGRQARGEVRGRMGLLSGIERAEAPTRHDDLIIPHYPTYYLPSGDAMVTRGTFLVSESEPGPLYELIQE